MINLHYDIFTSFQTVLELKKKEPETEDDCSWHLTEVFLNDKLVHDN